MENQIFAVGLCDTRKRVVLSCSVHSGLCIIIQRKVQYRTEGYLSGMNDLRSRAVVSWLASGY